MDADIFSDLMQSLWEAKAISAGQMQPARRTLLTLPDAKTVREKTGLSQHDFARMIRVSLKTLQNWEQHRRSPTGAAAALLTIVDNAPEAALRLLHPAQFSPQS